jgi:gliding motility-associated-like protein
MNKLIPMYFSTREFIHSNHSNKKNDSMMMIRLRFFILLIPIFFFANDIQAQVSGNWDSRTTTSTLTGYADRGNGVIQLVDNSTANACQGAAVHETSSTFNPAGDFNKCYQVFFGCPGNDNIGSDVNGDGMAFSFWPNGQTFTMNAPSCGGGLGYMNTVSVNKMITIEFDTYSSPFDIGNGFNGNPYTYGNGATGNEDEISVHINGDATTAGILTNSNAGNLEDGLEHTICIGYTAATRVLSVTIDGVSKLSYDMGLTNNLATYFGSVSLNQSWSSGKFGAANPATVNDGNGTTTIASQLSGPLCPAAITITAPLNGAAFDLCSGPVTISATTTPPAGNTVSFVEFFVDGLSIGTDNTAAYSISWNPTDGNHSLTAVAHYSPSNSTTTTAPATAINVSAGLQKTNRPPVGASDLIWGNYAAAALTKIPVGAVNISGAADLSANYKFMRDADSLYVLIDVTDNNLKNNGGVNPWESDGVELFIDKGNDKATTYGANDYQYAFVYTGAASEYYHSPASMTGVKVTSTLRTGGYVQVIRIPWATLGGAPANGESIGFDLHVNDSDGASSTRDSKLAWFDALDIAFGNPSGFGTIKAANCDPCPTGVLSGNTAICNDGTSTASLAILFSGASPWTFVYAIDGMNQPAVTGVTNPIYVFQSATGAHTYTLVSVTNALTVGCTGNATGTAVVTLNTTFPAVSDTTFIAPGKATLTVRNTTGTYEWYSALTGGSLVYTGTVFETPLLTDTTTYYVIETTAPSCYAAVTAYPITIPVAFFIPNLITPNSDGKNDQFEILGLPFGSELKVFNRWGNRVYESNNYDNLWAANNIGDGVYYYGLKLPNGKEYNGWLQIVR